MLFEVGLASKITSAIGTSIEVDKETIRKISPSSLARRWPDLFTSRSRNVIADDLVSISRRCSLHFRMLVLINKLLLATSTCLLPGQVDYWQKCQFAAIKAVTCTAARLPCILICQWRWCNTYWTVVNQQVRRNVSNRRATIPLAPLPGDFHCTGTSRLSELAFSTQKNERTRVLGLLHLPGSRHLLCRHRLAEIEARVHLEVCSQSAPLSEASAVHE